MNRPEDFQKFYYTKVGLGEGCGCAERVIDLHEMDRTMASGRGHSERRPGIIARLRAAFSQRRRKPADQD